MTGTPPPERHAVIIEDDEEIAELLATVLAQVGFQTHVTDNGEQGLELISEYSPLVTTLDVNLPGMDGFEVARRIRGFSTTYVIMLSARRDEVDMLTGLNAGADDYLAKPFRPRELRARIDAMLRRRRLDQQHGRPPGDGPEDADSDWLQHNGLRLHPSMHLVELDGQPVELTRREFDLISALMHRPRRVLSKDELTSLTRTDADSYVIEADRRSIETHIANLRRKLSDSPATPRFIETVRGVGYRLANQTRTAPNDDVQNTGQR
jgi:DNA-binding response OmpR family regulator